jgi:hypothetical protein
MSPFLLVTVVLVVLMAKRLADLYVGGHYACPSCGARSERHHSPDCPWSGSPSE